MQVRPLTAADAEACDAIVLSLPYHFGDEAGRADCAAAARSFRRSTLTGTSVTVA